MSRVLLGALGLSAALQALHAQTVIEPTRVVNDTLQFDISGADPVECIVQIGTNFNSGIVWHDVGPAHAVFSTSIVTDGRPRHFRIRCQSNGGFVYSVNAASYYSAQPPSGFWMLSYPLETPSNTLSNLLPTVSEGTLVHWYNSVFQQLEPVQFQFGRWSNPNLPIPRGRAVMLWNPPGAKAITLHGNFSGGTQTNMIPANLSMIAPWWPVDDSPLPEFEGMTVGELRGTRGIDPIYDNYLYAFGDWYDDFGNLRRPAFRAFSGLWISNPGSPFDWIWTRNGSFPLKAATNQGQAKGSGFAPVHFNNYVPGFGIDARLVHPNGEVPSGSNWLAQLYGGEVGTPENELVRAIGDPMPFLSGDEAGYLDTINGAVRILTNVTVMMFDAAVQIRFWDARTGATFESATVKAQTPMFLIPTRPQGPHAPPPLLGLRSPRLAVSRSQVPDKMHFTLNGHPGMTYDIQCSATLSHWTTVGTATNTTEVSTFVQNGASTNRHQFYRAAIRGPM